MDIEKIIDSELLEAVSSNYNVGKFTNSVIDAMLFLSNILRDKANIEDDGVKLINSIFTKKDPKIKITNLETETDRNIQEGISSILRGLYQSIRNPRHHEKIEDSEINATEIILFIDFILRIIEKSKAKFEVDDIESLVFDKEFVNDKEYTDLIINRIPKRKIFDVLINIYRNKTKGNIYHIQTFFDSIFERLSESEKSDFLSIISEDLLRTNDNAERRYIINCFPAFAWGMIDDISKRRTENIILKSIKEGRAYDYLDTKDGSFAIWCSQLFKYFTLKSKLLSVVSDIFHSEEISRIKYIFKYILNDTWDIIDRKLIEELINNDDFVSRRYRFLLSIKEEIEKGNLLFYDYIDDNKHQIPEYVFEFFKKSFDNFKENSDIKTISDDDHPDRSEDEAPF